MHEAVSSLAASVVLPTPAACCAAYRAVGAPGTSGLAWLSFGFSASNYSTLPTQAPGSHQQQHTLLKTGTCSAAAFAVPSQLMQCFQTLHHALNVSFILAPLALHGSKTMSTFLGLIEASTLNGD